MSIVILDELGASSAPTTSLPYTWTIAECLLSAPECLTLIATHNPWMLSLLMYPCSVNLTVYKYRITEDQIEVSELNEA